MGATLSNNTSDSLENLLRWTIVLRFTNDQDKELLREFFRRKPFAAVRGQILHVCIEVEFSLSSALGVQINVKQVRDSLTLLKRFFNGAEAAASCGSGIEESVDTVNVQSHYDEREGLVRECVALEDHFKAEKMAVKTKQQQKDEDLAKCAEELTRESANRPTSADCRVQTPQLIRFHPQLHLARQIPTHAANSSMVREPPIYL
ncbi:unnamed protein product [Phytophthora fragariaefolia]|uniref:Unnamed protein product n=1 Tax=Phytophthora fragariaefolia TaxID=1490495 RepID=A0A9W7D1P5_9STRA|nr:unnamed protein product [Phytophthora fragariaefolia]